MSQVRDHPKGQAADGLSGPQASASDHGDHDMQLTSGTGLLGKVLRPRSPTQQCHIPNEDRSHITLALMESQVGSPESEEIFHVQRHEMVCAITTQNRFMDRGGRMVSSLDVGVYWCNFCPFSSASKAALVQHVVQHRFHCKHCRYQSFSRADVLHHSFHMHSYFKEAGVETQICTLLSDYLLIQHLQNGSGDQCRKRKPPDGERDADGEPPSTKLKRAEQRYSKDYMLSDVGIGDIESEGGWVRGRDKISQGTSLSPSLSTTSPPSLDQTFSPQLRIPVSVAAEEMPFFRESSPHRDSNGVTQLVNTPPVLAAETPVNSGHQPCLSTHLPPPLPSCSPPLQKKGEESSQPLRTKLYLGCGYCKFTSSSKAGVKTHTEQAHSGKPHRVISLMKLENCYTPPVLPDMSRETFHTDRSSDGDKPLAEEVSETSSDLSALLRTNSNRPMSECDEPPVLVKQEPFPPKKILDPIKVRFPAPRLQTKRSALFKCYHCNFRARFFGTLRSHIVESHKGKCLVGVGGLKSLIFMCPHFSCNFRSWSGKTFLGHLKNCTRRFQSEAENTSADSHLKDCLQATKHLAEGHILSAVKVASPSKLATGKFLCMYCQTPYISSKSRTKEHVLECHQTQTLLIRNLHAHSRRRRSSVFFCRWCPWEGECKTDHDHHAIFCSHQTAPTVSQETASDGEGANDQASDAFPLHEDVPADVEEEDCEEDAEVKDDDSSSLDLEPPDIVHEQENYEDDGESYALLKTDDDIDIGGEARDYDRTTQPQPSCPQQDDAAFVDSFLSCSSIAAADCALVADSNSAGHVHAAIGSGIECLRCCMHLSSLPHLKEHMQSYHNQHVSFPFRSVYHKEKHNKSKFFACPSPECSVYRYSEADTVHHYRLHHSCQPHPYLDANYNPAPVVFRRRSKPCSLPKEAKPASAQAIPKESIDINEKPYLCLYCDKYFYTQTVGEMKAHHLSCHPGQPITVRDVKAFRYKKASRLAVCDQLQCDFKTYKPEQLAYHVAAQHSTQPPDMLLADHSFQCVSCGWITTDDSIVQEHVSMMHEGDGGATVVTLAHGDDKRTVEERFICAKV